MVSKRIIVITLSFLAMIAVAVAELRANQDEKETVTATLKPVYAALRFDEVNMRTGPGKRYPIEWVYKRKDMPIEITAEFDVWRRVRDWEGSEGWVHKSMLRYHRMAIITGKQRTLHLEPDRETGTVAQLEAGVIAELLACRKDWCRLKIDGMKGWLPKADFWGAAATEEFD